MKRLSLFLTFLTSSVVLCDAPYTTQQHMTEQQLHTLYRFLTAAKNAKVKKVKEFLKNGMHVDTCYARFADTSYQNSTALLLAADSSEVSEERTETVKTLIDAKANVNARNIYQHTPLILAARQNNIPVAQALIEANADVNAQTNNQDTALIAAVQRDNYEMAQMLIKADADVTIKGRYDCCALDYADTPEMRELLINAGATEE